VVALLLRDPRVLLLLGVALPLSWWYATNYTRFTRWALKNDVLLFREGWLKRTLVIVPRNRVQCALYEASPFDRRHRMARVVIDTAGGGRDTVRVPYLDAHVAATLARALYLSSAGAQYAASDEIEPEAV
jgi:membrane protein YdbS with pleckstrin-like domain